jgi:hypothetical protein
MIRVMLRQQVVTEVIDGITPHGMDMICLVFSVVEFNQRYGTLDSVVMRLADDLAAGPGKMQVLLSMLPDAIHFAVSQLLARPLNVAR